MIYRSISLVTIVRNRKLIVLHIVQILFFFPFFSETAACEESLKILGLHNLDVVVKMGQSGWKRNVPVEAAIHRQGGCFWAQGLLEAECLGIPHAPFGGTSFCSGTGSPYGCLVTTAYVPSQLNPNK